MGGLEERRGEEGREGEGRDKEFSVRRTKLG